MNINLQHYAVSKAFSMSFYDIMLPSRWLVYSIIWLCKSFQLLTTSFIHINSLISQQRKFSSFLWHYATFHSKWIFHHKTMIPVLIRWFFEIFNFWAQLTRKGVLCGAKHVILWMWCVWRICCISKTFLAQAYKLLLHCIYNFRRTFAMQ